MEIKGILKMKKIFLVLLFVFSTSLHAEEGFKLVLSAGLTGGGEKLISTTSGSSLTSGGLILLSAGSVYSFADSDFQIQGAFGYHFDELTATDGSATFSRTTLEILPFYQITETARVGLGLIHVMSPSYSDPYDSMTFDDTTGFLVEVDWRTQGSSWWGIRFANIDYTVATFNGIDVSSSAVPLDGNYFGVIFHAGF